MTPKLARTIAELTASGAGLPGWCTTDKATAMVELVFSDKPKLIVEIGAFGGRSFIPLALSLEELGTGLAVGIDPWDHGAALEGYDPTIEDDAINIGYWRKVPLAAIRQGCVDTITRLGLWHRCALLHARAEVVAPLFQQIDLLHIDGNHTELASCRDVNQWLPRVKPGGLLLFDDADWPSTTKARSLLASACQLEADHTTWHVYRLPARTPPPRML